MALNHSRQSNGGNPRMKHADVRAIAAEHGGGPPNKESHGVRVSE